MVAPPLQRFSILTKLMKTFAPPVLLEYHSRTQKAKMLLQFLYAIVLGNQNYKAFTPTEEKIETVRSQAIKRFRHDLTFFLSITLYLLVKIFEILSLQCFSETVTENIWSQILSRAVRLCLQGCHVGTSRSNNFVLYTFFP